MAAGDLVIRGWKSTVGDYYKEFAPDLGFSKRLLEALEGTSDLIHTSKVIDRKLLCSTEYVDEAIAAAGTSGTSLSIPIINSSGALTTKTLTGRWKMLSITPAKYATGYTLLTMRCQLSFVTAFTFGLPSLVTIVADGSDTSKVHLKYNGTIIKTWDGGEDGNGLDIIAQMPRGQFDCRYILDLYCNGTKVETYTLDKGDFPLTQSATSTLTKLKGPLTIALTEEEIQAMADALNVPRSKISVQTSTVSTPAGATSTTIVTSIPQMPTQPPPSREPVYPLDGAGNLLPAGSRTPREPIINESPVASVSGDLYPARQYSTETKTAYTYYWNKPYYYVDINAEKDKIRKLGGLNWVKSGTTLQLRFGTYVWMQFDTTGLEPGP